MLRCQIALIAVSLGAAAQGRGSVSDLVALVRDELQRARSDSHIAKDVHKAHLAERLWVSACAGRPWVPDRNPT